MEQQELSTEQLQKFLPHLTSASKEWGVDPNSITQLFNNYLRLKGKKEAVYQLTEKSPSSSMEDYQKQILLITIFQQQQPLSDWERNLLFCLPRKEGVSSELLEQKYKEYKTAQEMAFFDCYQLAQRILSQLGEEDLTQISQADTEELKRLSQERGFSHLITCAIDIYRVQQNIQKIRDAKVRKDFFLLTTEDARKLMQPINDINNIIHNFVYQVLSSCGGNLNFLNSV